MLKIIHVKRPIGKLILAYVGKILHTTETSLVNKKRNVKKLIALLYFMTYYYLLFLLAVITILQKIG